MSSTEVAIPPEYTAVVSRVHDLLESDDAPGFWTTLIVAALRGIDARCEAVPSERRTIALCISRLSRWMRPNRARWILGGGFAWPKSYSTHAEANADWLFWIVRKQGASSWLVNPREPKSKRGAFRASLAAPSGTARNPQGAAILVWRSACPYEAERGAGTVRQLYGLRRGQAGWEVVVQSEYGELRT